MLSTRQKAQLKPSGMYLIILMQLSKFESKISYCLQASKTPSPSSKSRSMIQLTSLPPKHQIIWMAYDTSWTLCKWRILRPCFVFVLHDPFSGIMFSVTRDVVMFVYACRRLTVIIVTAAMLALSLLGFGKPTEPHIFYRYLVYFRDLISLVVWLLVIFLSSVFNFWRAVSCVHVSKRSMSENSFPHSSILITLILTTNVYVFVLMGRFYNCSFVILGWILVAGTFILAGIFLLFHK